MIECSYTHKRWIERSPVDENGKRWASTQAYAWSAWEHGYEKGE